MGVEIKGEKELLRQLEARIGEREAKRISDEALKQGARVFVKELERQFETFKDTGASIDEISLKGPLNGTDGRLVKVHWKGPNERYRIIHLNEWGTIQNPNPKGKGAIARALKNSEDDYRAAVKKAIEEGI